MRFGSDAIAVQKVGIQIESISYMTIGGLQGAIAAFFGQNYGVLNRFPFLVALTERQPLVSSLNR
ncbi:hypothetical protein [Paenibacillus popilliae]|uniref:hypothetical protein n=1 Tax=Paenibacillus popilliae TaxID=78057 RepID=UPI001F159EC4|nr:hypothetical protein [Paenibacillus popilliae]